MLETIVAYIERHQLLPARGTIIVAVSGGADSLCLLHILHRLCGEGETGKRYPAVRVHVAHLNHQLRGEAGCQDAAAVAQLAEAWGLPISIGEIDVPALARQEKRSLEEAARTARYRFLREVAQIVQGGQGGPIAVAHHADDQVETLLLHWLRGGGLAGMIGMLPRQQDIIRPLLAVRHAETVAYCQQHGLTPLEDASNTDPSFLRNRIRHELLPLLTSMNAGIRATLLRNAEVVQVDVEWIEQQVDQAWPSAVIVEQTDSILIDIAILLTLPLSLQRHLLRRVTARLCGGQSPLELRHHLLIEQAVQRTAPDESIAHALDMPGQLHITVNMCTLRFDRLHDKAEQRVNVFSALDSAIILPIPGRIAVSGTPWVAAAEEIAGELLRTVRMALVQQDWPAVWRLLPSTRYSVYIDAGQLGSSLQVRTRHSGDRLRPLGMAAEKKVQDVLVNAHIARADRATILLFFSTSHCLWVAGVQIDDRVRLTPQTQRILHLSIVEAASS